MTYAIAKISLNNEDKLHINFIESDKYKVKIGKHNSLLPLRDGVIKMIEMYGDSDYFVEYFRKKLDITKSHGEITIRGHPRNIIELVIFIAKSRGIISHEEILAKLEARTNDV